MYKFAVYWYLFLFFLLVVCAVFFRFYNYSNRWGLAYDQAHDAVLAKYALQQGYIPLVGPFSSAGPFQTGGEWYWILMMLSLFPYAGYMTPWFSMTFVSIIFVVFIALLGKQLFGKAYGLFAGLLAAISPSQLGQSVNLTNQSPLPLLSLLTLLSGIKLIKTEKTIYAFLLGLFASFSATVHLQGAALVVVVFVSHLLAKFQLKKILFSGLGYLLPLFPLIYFDILYNGVNVKGFFQYLFIAQHVVSYDVLGRRWLTFLSTTIPREWARITGGSELLVQILVVCLSVLILVEIARRNLRKELLLVVVSFIGMIVVVRYTRTPLFSSYFNFLHPFIFLLTSYSVVLISKYNKALGISICTLIIYFSSSISLNEIEGGRNITHDQVISWVESIETILPNQTIRVYDLGYRYRDKSLPFILVADSKGIVTDNGYPIGIAVATTSKPVFAPVLFGDYMGYQFFDLATFSAELLSQNNWVLVTPSEVYKSTQEWPNK